MKSVGVCPHMLHWTDLETININLLFVKLIEATSLLFFVWHLGLLAENLQRHD